MGNNPLPPAPRKPVRGGAVETWIRDAKDRYVVGEIHVIELEARIAAALAGDYERAVPNGPR